MNGKIFSIEEFATFDGPGIRTTVFLKGCPLTCLWCHNPEGQSFESEYARSFNGCVYCGKCEGAAIKSDGRLVYTKESKAACPKGLIRQSGMDLSAEELVEKLLKNRRILNSTGGGVTFSGGEPLSQSDFLLECISLIDKRLRTAIQTSGFTSEESFEKFLAKIDYCLFDLKILRSQKHRAYCGVDNSLILSNYKRLVKSGKSFITRVPLIPGLIETRENLTDIAEFMASLAVGEVEVLPYNQMAGSKYESVGRRYDLPKLEEEKVSAEEIFALYNIRCKRM